MQLLLLDDRLKLAYIECDILIRLITVGLRRISRRGFQLSTSANFLARSRQSPTTNTLK